jgi:glycerophosphoryl diester phosphodiesterase
MNTIKFSNNKGVKMIAHRGVSGLELENTCPAFVAAGVKSYFGIETDVHVTKDGKYIVHHDDDTSRLAEVNLPLEQTDFATLRALRLKDTDGKTERMDLFLPSLEEYISICKKYDKVSVLELKCAMEEKHVVGIAKVIQEMGWFEKTIFISFEGQNLVYLKKHFPSATAQFLTCDATEENLQFMIENDLDADLCGYCVSKEYVDKLHAAGKKVNCWTIDKIEHAEYMQACGVDFITSNILE